MKKYKKYRNGKNTTGFTLVEVLISVGIIGIIAAITIPAILASTSSKALEAQRKALHSRMAQAFGQIKNLKSFENYVKDEDDEGETIYVEQDSALEFITSGLSKVYKITNTCDAGSLRECGIPDLVYDYYSDTDSTNYDLSEAPNLHALNENISVDDDLGGLEVSYAGFKTANGESILLWYNPRCKTKTEVSPHNLAYSVCVNMIYDLNGRNTAPNAYGEDIGYITVFYPTDSMVVAPVLYNQKSFTDASYSAMLAQASELDLVPPTIEELVSVLINKKLTNITKSGADIDKLMWSSTYSSEGATSIWAAGQVDGIKKENVTTTAGSDVTHPYFLLKK